MPRSQFSSEPPAETPFLNREKQLARIASQVSILNEDPAHLGVLEVLGLGGTGKTRLLEEVWNNCLESSSADYLLWVSLEGEGATMETGPLLSMRDQLDFDCLLFDTALLAYWNATGQPLQLDRSDRLARSLPVKALELGGSVGGFVLPIGFGAEVFRSFKRTAVKRSRYKQHEFEELERFQKRPAELLKRLPHYLGLDLKRFIEPSEQWCVAFYDAYDRQRSVTRRESAPWMQEFIGTLDRGVHVVSTREPLEWSKADWDEVVDRVPLEKLPRPDAQAMVRSRLGRLSPDVEERLISASRRIPFVLDTVINGYKGLLEQGEEIGLDDLPTSPDSAVAHFVKHLPAEQRDLAVALATIQVFDEKSFRHLVTALNLQVSYLDFERFLRWYFVEAAPPGLYKTHDLLTAFVRESMPEEPVRRTALEAACEHLLTRCQVEAHKNPDQVLRIFGAVVSGWRCTEQMPLAAIEQLIDAGLLLYDAGYWNELSALAAEGPPRSDHEVGVICEFLRALTARRVAGIEQARSQFAELMPRIGSLGRHSKSVELEAANVTALAGSYREVRRELARLAEDSDPFDPTDRMQLRSRMYHGGMLLLDGHFEESSRLLYRTYEAVDAARPGAIMDWGELVRFRGHAHRFCFALEGAEELYLRAMRATANGQAPALLGRLQTNLAETYCWHRPRRALGAADASAEINLGLGNETELAKSEVARGIALGKLEEFDPARRTLAGARERAERVGYLAGVAFALQAQVVVEWLADEFSAAEAADDELAEVLVQLDTYTHLRTVPHFLLGDESGFETARATTEWIDPDGLESRLSACFMP